MSTTATASLPYGKYYCPIKEGRPPQEDPPWVDISFWSCLLFFFVTLSLHICWIARTRARKPRGDVEQGRLTPPEQDDNDSDDDGDRWDNIGLWYGVEVFRKSGSGSLTQGKRDERRPSNWATEECVICLEEFHDGDVQGVLTVCSHVYHKTCLDRWLAKDDGEPTCPLCRAPPSMIVHTKRETGTGSSVIFC
ncbi:unnamed protein product [Linum trigynum]|uniref:RING-type E3 ubiquitin transferase n=1 Tax=Linum trigynum TaxID=586398 RepID=A0AAV2CDS8_9ROSI